MSALDVLPPKERALVEDLMRSETHARMFRIGAIVTKVAAMFGTEGQPTDAMAAFVMLLEGMESGDADTYARHEAIAISLHEAWLARKELH